MKISYIYIYIYQNLSVKFLFFPMGKVFYNFFKQADFRYVLTTKSVIVDIRMDRNICLYWSITVSQIEIAHLKLYYTKTFFHSVAPSNDIEKLKIEKDITNKILPLLFSNFEKLVSCIIKILKIEFPS